jgi:hypothetical protein
MNSKTSSVRALIAIITLALPLAANPAAADDASDFQNQLVVFGGMSILDASRTSTTTWRPDFPGFPGWPGRPGFGSGRFPEIEVRTSTSLGNSVVFGARYSRYVKDRLAVEADIAVGPSHDLKPDGEVCFEGRCFGGGDFDRFPVRPPGGDLDRWRGQSVTAWQYGGGLAYDITGGDVRPVIVFGAGGASWSGSGRTETDFELRFGAGLKILFGRVGARVDVIDHLVLDHFISGKSEHNLHVTAGLLVGF